MRTTLATLLRPIIPKMTAAHIAVAPVIMFPTPNEFAKKPGKTRPNALEKFRITSFGDLSTVQKHVHERSFSSTLEWCCNP